MRFSHNLPVPAYIWTKTDGERPILRGGGERWQKKRQDRQSFYRSFLFMSEKFL